jgi:hypothetical protein
MLLRRRQVVVDSSPLVYFRLRWTPFRQASAYDAAVWSLEGYLKLAKASVQAEQAETLSRSCKSIIAFIRYGHGEKTIDEYGEWSDLRMTSSAGWSSRLCSFQNRVRRG